MSIISETVPLPKQASELVILQLQFHNVLQTIAANCQSDRPISCNTSTNLHTNYNILITQAASFYLSFFFFFTNNVTEQVDFLLYSYSQFSRLPKAKSLGTATAYFQQTGFIQQRCSTDSKELDKKRDAVINVGFSEEVTLSAFTTPSEQPII